MSETTALAGAPDRRGLIVCAAVAALLCLAAQLVLGRTDLNLRDEGYLWYGVVALLDGDVPLRDFQAYDPGRYLWCAAWSPLFGSGIVGVRAAVAVFQVIGLFCGLCVMRRVLRHDGWMLPAGVLLMLWMFPRHKLFEPALVLVGVLAATRLVERPVPRRFLEAGLVCGLAAFFGRNHGLYLVLAFLGLFALLRLRGGVAVGARALGTWAAGVALGYAPMLVMLVLVPGFASGFVDAVLAIQEHGANVPLPYRWPWSAERGDCATTELALDVAYLLPVLLLPTALFVVLRTRGDELRGRAPLVAAVLVGAIYAHHYSVRSDLPHLAQAIAPVLIAALALPAALPAGRARASLPWILLALLFVHALPIAVEGNPALKQFVPGSGVQYVEVEVAGERLRIKRAHGGDEVLAVQEVVGEQIGPDEEIFIGPTTPTYYPVLGRRSPLWWIYMLWSLSDAEQDAIVARLREREVDWALIVQRPFGRDKSFNLAQTNPRLWEHFSTEWAPVPDPRLPKRYFLLRRR